MVDDYIPHHVDSKFDSIIGNYLRGKGQDSTTNDHLHLRNCDRFGVLHPGGLPETPRDKVDEKCLWRRIEKWRQMTSSSNWPCHFHDGTPSETLLRRTFKGVPPQLRTVVWPLFLDAPSVKRQNPNVYSNMLRQALTNSADIGQIDLDICRAFRNTTYFYNRFGPRQVDLFKILVAYTAYDTEVGYCQGMSEVVGMLLTYIVDDEDAFWAFAQLMASPRHMMRNVFKYDFPGLSRLYQQHMLNIRQFLPPVDEHFIRHQLETSTYTIKWFMQCYLNRLPYRLVLRVWDIYLLRGECIVIAMAYNILKMHQKRLLRMDGAEILTFLQDGLPKDFGYDDKKVIQSLQTCLNRLERHNMARPPLVSPKDDQSLPRSPFGTRVSTETVSHASSSLVETDTVVPDIEKAARQTLKQIRPASLSILPNEFENRRQAHNVRTDSASPDNTNKASASNLPTRPGLLNSAAVVTMSAMHRQDSSESRQVSSKNRQGLAIIRLGLGDRTQSDPRYVQSGPISTKSRDSSATDNQWLRQAVADEINRPTLLSHRVRIMDHPNFRVSPNQSEVTLSPMDGLGLGRSSQYYHLHPHQQRDQTSCDQSAPQKAGINQRPTVISIKQPNTVDALNPSERPALMRRPNAHDRPPTDRHVFDKNPIRSQLVLSIGGTVVDSGDQFVCQPVPDGEAAARLPSLLPTTSSNASRGL